MPKPSHTVPPKGTKETPSMTTVLNYTHASMRKGISVMDPSSPLKPKDAEEFDASVAAPVRTEVKNAWMAPEWPTLNTMGFEVRKQTTTLKEKDFLDDKKVKSVYYKELQDFICQVTGATKCVAFHHMVRMADATQREKLDPTKTQAPAGVIHCDYTCRSSIDMFDDMCPKQMQKGRFIVINAWRNISDTNPIVDNHLAMLDSRAIIAPDDFVPWDVVQANGTSAESYRMDPGHAKRHQWYYYPNMVKDDVLLFVQYDSDPASKCRYNFHTACKDPNAPNPAPFGRCSLELRTIAFLPDHTPCTVPENRFTGTSATKRIVQKIMQGVQHGDDWDENGREWAQLTVHKPNGINDFLKEQIKHHGSTVRGAEELTPAQKKEITDMLLNDHGIEALAKSIFPPSTKAQWEHGSKSIKNWLSNQQGNEWGVRRIREEGGGASGLKAWLEEICDNGAREGHWEMKDATPDTKRKVIDTLMADKVWVEKVVNNHLPPKDLVGYHVKEILGSLKHIPNWPAEGKKWAVGRITAGRAGCDELASSMVRHGAKNGHHGMKGVGKPMQDLIEAKLLDGPAFQQAAEAAIKDL